jgi:hypothetical protein
LLNNKSASATGAKRGISMKKLGLLSAALLGFAFLSGCGGGGGNDNSSGAVISHPYQNVYGSACSATSPTPGCTFLTSNGKRVTVVSDLDYNKNGKGSNDMYFVKFHSNGTADVYNQYGTYVETKSTSAFAGYISGNTIGVGTTGLYWENVANGTYWLGRNGVLYNAMSKETNFGQAINSKEAKAASNRDFVVLSSDANKRLVASASLKLQKDYDLSSAKATAVASALNSWAVSAANRGYTTPADLDKTFKTVFGVNYNSALAAVKSFKGVPGFSARSYFWTQCSI